MDLKVTPSQADMRSKDVPDAAINYVWDNLQPKGTERANACTDRTQMLVLRSDDADAGRWVWERSSKRLGKWLAVLATA